MRLFLLTQRFDEQPHEYVTRSEASTYVEAGLAKWHSGSRAIKLTTLQKPKPRFRDVSASMHGRVSEHEQLERLLAPTEAGRILGYCARTMQRKALSGELPYVQVSCGRIRFQPSKLKQYIEAREVTPKAA